MESEQGNKTEETHLQHKICIYVYNILKDSVNNIYSQLSAGQSLITLLEKQLLAQREQFVEKRCVVDKTVVGLENNDILSNLTLKISSNDKLDSVFYLKSVDEKAYMVWNNKIILTRNGGETKDGERKNDNARNDGKKAESKQNAGKGGAQGLSGFMSTSTSGSSSGGDGGDGKGGNDDGNKTPSDLLVEDDLEEEEAEKNEEETREIKEEIEKREETQAAERAGQDEDGDVCRQEKTTHSIETHREQERDLQLWLSKIQLKLPTFGQNLCRPLHQFPWFYLTECDQLIQSDLLPFIGEKQENVKIISASARHLFAYISDVIRSDMILWMERNQIPTIGLHRPANVKLQTSNYAGSQMQNKQPETLLTENALRRRNSCQRFQVVILTICVFDGRNQSGSSVIITDPGLSPDPRNMIRRWPQNLQKILKGVLYCVSLSFQRSMTSRALVQRHGLLQHPVTCISQTTNCIRTMLSPSLCLSTFDRRVFTVSATLLPTGCLLPCPWSSITAILTVTQQIQELQQFLFIQTNAGSGLSEMSQCILSFETPILGDTFRNMQKSALSGASHMVNVIHPRTVVFMRTEQLTEPTLPMADSDKFPCQQPQQHQDDMQGETAHQPRQTLPMAATDNTPRLQQPQVWAAPFKATSKVDSQSQIMTKSSAERSLSSIRRAPTSRQVGALRQTRRSYIPVDHSCLEQHVMLKQAQLLFLQQHQTQANRLQNEPLPLAHLNTVSAFMPFANDASDDARHPSAAGQVVNPNDIGVHHPSLNSTDFPVSRMDSVVGQRANQHPKSQQVWYSGQPHSSAKFRTASGSNVSPVRGYPGPPNLSSQDQSGNRERRGVQDYRAAQQSILSNAERVGGPPNRASSFDFSSTIMGLQPNSPHAESLSNPHPVGPVRGLGGFPFEPGDQDEHENRAQGFRQAQHRPQRGGRRPHRVCPQCSEDLAASPNSSSDHDVNQRRQETTGGLRSSPQQHLTNQRELPFPTQCQEHVHPSNHGEVPHDNANGRPAQQGPPAPNNYQRYQINVRGCTVVAKPDHMTAAELDS